MIITSLNEVCIRKRGKKKAKRKKERKKKRKGKKNHWYKEFKHLFHTIL